MNNHNCENKRSADLRNHCFICDINGGCKKLNFYLRGNFSIKICLGCINQSGSSALALEKAQEKFNQHGKFYFSKTRGDAQVVYLSSNAFNKQKKEPKK